MKVYDSFKQGSREWLEWHVGRPTASEFDNIICLNGDPREGETRKTYLATKVAEKWMGGPLPGADTWDMEQGKILEERAIPFYELEYREEVRRVGFVTNNTGTVGCSPDGLLPGAGLEIKCLQPVHHTKCLLAKKVPNCFKAQIYASLYVTGLPEWKLLLYSRHFPKALFVIRRDEAMMAKIDEAVTGFLADFKSAMDSLRRLNGGDSDEPLKEADWISKPLPKEAAV